MILRLSDIWGAADKKDCRVDEKLAIAAGCKSLVLVVMSHKEWCSVPVLPGELEIRFFECGSCHGGYCSNSHKEAVCRNSDRAPRCFRHAALIRCVGEGVAALLADIGIDSIRQWQDLENSDKDLFIQRCGQHLASRVAELQQEHPGAKLCSDDAAALPFLEEAVRAVLGHNVTLDTANKVAVFRGRAMNGGSRGECEGREARHDG